MRCMFQLPKGWRVSSGGCCTCSSWGRSLLNAGRQLLLSRRPGRQLVLSRQPGVDFFFQIRIYEFGKLVAEHLQVGLRIRRAVMLQSIHVHGVERLEVVDRDSLGALPSPTLVGRDFVHQLVQLTFDLPRSSPEEFKLSGLARPESGCPEPHRVSGLVGASVLVVRLTQGVYCAAHVLAYIGVRFCHPAAQVSSVPVHISYVVRQSGRSSEDHLQRR
jgi:hypothetical protein